MTVDLTYWQAALAGDEPAVDANTPQQGYYRRRMRKGGPWLPVVIWRHKDSGALVARVGADMADPADIWLSVAHHPVPKVDAMHAFRNAGAWPGDAPPVSAGIGDNNPPADVVDLIPLEVEAAAEFLARVPEIKSQVESDIASNKVANLRDLKSKAAAEHKTAKEPHLAAGRAVDKRYLPLVDEADKAIRRLLAAVTAFQSAEDARLRREAAERAAIERAQHERAAAIAKQHDIEAPPAPTPVEAPKVRSGGATGKVVTLRTYKVARVADYDAALVALRDHPEVRELVQRLADRACKAGVPLAGVEFTEEKRAV